MKSLVNSLCLLIIAISWLVGCSSPLAQPVAPEPVSITFYKRGYVEGGTDITSVTNAKAVEMFEQRHPDIKVNIVGVPWTLEGDAQLQAALESGQDINVFSVNPDDLIRFAREGKVSSLEPFLTDADRADFYASGLQVAAVDGQVYTWPIWVTASSMFANKELLAERGVELPTIDDPWSWDQFVAAAKQLTFQKSDGRPVYGFTVSADWWTSGYYPIFYIDGGRILSPDGRRFVQNGPEALSGLQKVADLAQVHRVTPPDFGVLDQAKVGEQFRNGEVAMLISTPAFIRQLEEEDAISQVRQYLIAFGSQADRVLAPFDRERELGPATQSELMVLVQNYQIPLLRAIRDFEQFEASRVEAARQQARRLIQTTVSSLVVIAVIVLMMALVMSRQILVRLIGPLAEVQTGVEAIRQGRLDNPIQFDHQDEIGRLGGALNTMSAELQRYQGRLEELVAERTAELRREISQRQLVEDKLRQSQALYRSIVSASPDGITIFSLSGLVEFVSPAGVKMFGYSTIEEMMGRSVLDFISPNESELVATRLREMARGEVLMPIEYRAVKKDGQVFDIEANTEVIRDANGQPSAVISIIRDITERKQVEEALRASEEKYHQLFELGSDAVFLIDNETGQILEVNAAASTMYGYSRDELLQKRNVDLSAEPDKTRQAMQNYLTSIPVRFHRKNDGAVLPVEITASHFNWRGRPVHIAAIRDITERVQADEALRQAKDAAEVSNRAKSAFLANMSHELRTPLNAILGFAQLMARDPNLPPKHQDNLAVITTSGEHLLTLINQVLDLSKIEAGRMSLEEKNFDLYRLLGDLEGMFQLRAADKGLRLIFDRLPDVPQYICADEIKLRQVLMNLLSNAVKFTEAGSVTVRVGIRKQELAYLLNFSISDTGPGIAPEEVATLFEAFTQTRTGRQAQEGTGLGLAISQKFVQLMGGEIRVESEVGQGTMLSFDIRVKLCETAPAQKAAIDRRVVGLEPGQPAYRLLIVDDKWDNRRLLVELLAPLGFELQEAENGRQAIEIWTSWQPHLIWLDLRMPEIDGYKAVKQIKAKTHNQTLGTVIIAISAGSLEEEQTRVLQAGCDDFVRKPFREADIFEMLTQHLGVRFVYAESDPHQQLSYLDQKVDVRAWQSLPGELLVRLEEAVTRLDIDAIKNLIEEIHGYDAAMSEELTALVDEFKFGVMLVLIQAAKKSSNE